MRKRSLVIMSTCAIVAIAGVSLFSIAHLHANRSVEESTTPTVIEATVDPHRAPAEQEKIPPWPAAADLFAGPYSQKTYLRLRKIYTPTYPAAAGALTGRHLKGALTLLQSEEYDPGRILPIVEDIFRGRTLAVEEALEEGLSPDSTLFIHQYRYSFNAPLLDFAIQAGQRTMVKFLLAHGASPNPLQAARLIKGMPPQFQAPLPIAAGLAEDDVVEVLLDYGANIEQKSSIPGMDQTALSAAVNSGNVSTAYLLLMRGADIQSALRDGRIPRIVTVTPNDRDMKAMRQLLLAHGALPASGESEGE